MAYIIKNRMKNHSVHCKCHNIIAIDSNVGSQTPHKKGIIKSSSENLSRYPFVECRISSLHPKCIHSQNSNNSNKKIHRIGPKSIYISNPSKTYALLLSDCCFELICEECASCFWIKIDSSHCYLYEKGKVDFNDIQFKPRSLSVYLPLQLRKYLNFDHCIFSEQFEEKLESENTELDNFQQSDGIVVGSFCPSSSVVLSFVDLLQ